MRVVNHTLNSSKFVLGSSDQPFPAMCLLAALSGRKARETSEAKCAQIQPSLWNSWLRGGCCRYCRALKQRCGQHFCKLAKPLRDCVSSFVWPRQQASPVPAPSLQKNSLFTACSSPSQLSFLDCSISFAHFIFFFWLHLFSPEEFSVSCIKYFASVIRNH